MLVGCRAFSSDQETNNFFNLIPHCVAIGEAAGTAAALSLDQNVSPRDVDFAAVRKQLLAQNCILPGHLGKNSVKNPEAYKFKVPRFGGPPSKMKNAPKVEH